MNLFTSYYNNPIKLDVDDTMYVYIARYKPKWFEGPEYKTLAPPEELLDYYKRGVHGTDKSLSELHSVYINYYLTKVLDIIKPETVVNELMSMANARGKSNVVMLCYEKSSDFCHRHIVSKWLEYNGYECKELTSELLAELTSGDINI